jgi:protease-4
MRQFLQQSFASLVGTLAALLVLLSLGVSGLVVLLITAITTGSETPQVKNKSVLVFDLSTTIRDTEPTVNFTQALSRTFPDAIALRPLLEAIEKASQDQRIVALLLDGSHGISSSDYAQLKEVRAALEKFRATGKKIIAYGIDWGERDYYLGSIADEIILHPMGTLEFNGLSAEQAFFTGALDKFGVGIQVVRVGKYKSAVEPFTQKQLSPENRQQLENLLGDIWGDVLATVSESRKISTSQLQAISNTKGFLIPTEATADKLVDRVAYFDEVSAELEKLTGKDKKKDSFQKVSLETYLNIPVKEAKQRSSDNKIAVIYGEGQIVGGTGENNQMGSERLNKSLKKAREDDKVKAIVLRINSPGGSATASELILREVQLLGEQKPVIVSMGSIAASGGYWIATGADYIFAQPNTISGSIGVFGLLPNIQKITNDNGVTWDRVKIGQLADMDTLSRPKTPQEIALYQRFVNRIYNLFLDKVAQSRKLPKAKVAQLAQGRVWSGQDAKQLGLVDELGGIEAAIAYAAKKVNLGEDWEVQEYLEEPTLETQLIDLLATRIGVERKMDPLSLELNKFKEELMPFQILSDPRSVYAIFPFKIRID